MKLTKPNPTTLFNQPTFKTPSQQANAQNFKNLNPNYRLNHRQQKLMETSVPPGFPKVSQSGSTAIGPNAYNSLPQRERKGFNSGYPMKIDVPASAAPQPDKRMPFQPRTPGYKPEGPATIQTGPSLLPMKYRMAPGPVNYSQTPDLILKPSTSSHPQYRNNAQETHFSPWSGTSKTGLPSDSAGRPTLPSHPPGYNLSTQQNATAPARHPDSPVSSGPHDPYGIPSDTESL